MRPLRAAVAVMIVLAGATVRANPTFLENLKPGTAAWQPRHPAVNHEIEGYASRTSVNRGEDIELFVNTPEASFSLEVFRMGWYNGLGARRMYGPVDVPGTAQVIPTPDPQTGLIECDWKRPFVLAIPYSAADPTEWASGVYLAKLTANTSRTDAYIIFVVRDDARPSPLLFQTSVTTYEAYNGWGGKSLYRMNSEGGIAAQKVSFNRPYNILQGNGAGHFALSGGWEYTMVRFIEREGFDVTYCTNIDVHQNRALIGSHKAFLSVGHDEYWSWQMRQNVTAARDAGVHLGFFSANTCFWQIRLEPSTITAAPDRTIVAYKERALLDDPLALDNDPTNDYLITTQWRRSPVNDPERRLIGVMFVHDPVDADIVVEKTDHWVFDKTGLRPGDHLPRLLGYEVDAMGPESPAGTIRLAHSPFIRSDGATDYSDMTIYTANSGAMVFAVGSIWWSWGLDDFNTPRSRPPVAHPAVQQITRNVLRRFAGLPDANRRRRARH
ncbi:MAG: hypothetical protein NVSMB68_05740 [Thermoanaerobaculia bacterium]